MLEQLRNGGDIPKTLNLPKTIEGTNINPNADKVEKVEINNGGSTTLKEAGEKGKRQSGVTYLPGPDLYIAYDVADTSNKCQGSTEAEALAELEKKTGGPLEVAPWQTGGALPRNRRAAGQASHQTDAERENTPRTGRGDAGCGGKRDTSFD